MHFLAYILETPERRQNLHILSGRTVLVWGRFTKDVGRGLIKSRSEPAFQGELKNFAEKFRLSLDLLNGYIYNDKWSDLVKFLIEKSK